MRALCKTHHLYLRTCTRSLRLKLPHHNCAKGGNSIFGGGGICDNGSASITGGRDGGVLGTWHERHRFETQ